MPRPASSELTSSAQYRPEVVELALTTFAVEGSAKRAEAVVRAKFGKGPTDATISKWANETHNAEYLRIREGVAEKIKARVATDVEDELRETLQTLSKARKRVDKEIDGLDARDTPGALRNVATSAAILADKLHQMRGDNTIHIEHTLNADELLAKLGAVFGGVAPSVEGSVTEITERADNG